MPIKIIKPGEGHTAKVEEFTFQCARGDPEFEVAGQLPWLTSPSFHTVKAAADDDGAKEAHVPEPTLPPLDRAQIEKTAYESGFRQGEKVGLEIAEKKV